MVLAVPQRDAHALLPDGALDDPDRLLRIGTAPILNLHVVYDRTVLRRPFFAALGSPVQWVFDRTDASGLRDAPGAGDSQYLAVSQSAAQDDIDRPVAELRARYLPELERLLSGRPRRGGTGLLRHPGAHRDVRPGPRRRPAAARRPHQRARPVPGRCVDRHRLARDHGRRRAQRAHRGSRRPLAKRPPACDSASRRRRGDAQGGGMSTTTETEERP